MKLQVLRALDESAYPDPTSPYPDMTYGGKYPLDAKGIHLEAWEGVNDFRRDHAPIKVEGWFVDVETLTGLAKVLDKAGGGGRLTRSFDDMGLELKAPQADFVLVIDD